MNEEISACDPESRRGRVLMALRQAQAKAYPWLSGVVIASREIGGSEGLRRVRELRAMGYNIEHRRIEGSTAHEYRLGT